MDNKNNIDWNKLIAQNTGPVVSGGLVTFLLYALFTSDLDGSIYYCSLVLLVLMFLSSVWLYYYLSKLEQNKDITIIKAIRGIVGDVFSYAKDPKKVTPKEVNDILCTIVNLNKEMNIVGIKDYKNKINGK